MKKKSKFLFDFEKKQTKQKYTKKQSIMKIQLVF